jgi:hypothetical protein
MKKLLLILSLLSSTAFANSNSLNLQLPNGQNNYSSDKFKAGDLDCQNAIGGSTNLEFGVTGLIDNYQSPFDNNTTVGNSTKDIGVYARITIPLDGPKERINCNTLYQLELKKKRLEVLKLEQELKKLRELQLKNKLNNNVKTK